MRYILLLLFLTSCSTHGPVTEKPAEQITAPVVAQPGEPSEVLPRPVVGWPKEYDKFVKDLVSSKASLTSISSDRMSGFCPNWGSMDKDSRIQFWVDLMYSITKPESNYDRSVMYWEDSQGTDYVTGLKVKTSEGLLQLSYSDVKTYRGKCKFDYAKDKLMHEDDIKSKPSSHSWKSKHIEKTILDPYLNLECGIEISDTMFDLSSWFNREYPRQKGYSFERVMGNYWATMKPSREGYAVVIKQMKSRNSKCYQ